MKNQGYISYQNFAHGFYCNDSVENRKINFEFLIKTKSVNIYKPKGTIT